MQDTKSSAKQHPEAESEDVARFDTSLQELKDLCSQLHHAAEYCETTFLKAEQKTAVVENTKEYVCKAVVTVIDHLGSISANLECRLSKSDSISQTELRMDSLRQRLLTCQQYSNKLTLSKFCWNADFIRYHPRYISPPISDSQKAEGLQRSCLSTPVSPKTAKVHEFDAEEEVPLFFYTFNCKPSLIEDLTRENNPEESDAHSAPVLPVRDGLSELHKPQPRFQFQEDRKLKRNLLNWKYVQNKDLISLIRRGRRTST